MNPGIAGDSRALLSGAVDLMSASLHSARGMRPTLSTPCAEWRLGRLVGHVADSAAALSEIIAGAAPAPAPATGCLRARLGLDGLRRAMAGAPVDDLAVDLAALTGAFELTVHAWDVDTSIGAPRRLPADHVGALLALAPIVLGGLDRTDLFAASRPAAVGGASDTDRLLALFGRRVP